MPYSCYGKMAVCLAVSLIAADTASAMVHVEDTLDLGTTRPGNAGRAGADAVSADGRIVAGSVNVKVSGQHDFLSHAILWIFSGNNGGGQPKKKDLGTLNRVPGRSFVKALSDDGSIAAGSSQYKTGSKSNEDYHAAIWWSDDHWNHFKSKDLGTWKDHNAGESRAWALSGNGTIAGGYAEYSPSGTSTSYTHATIWTTEDNWETFKMHDLSTFDHKDQADSQVYALSKDGQIAGGQSEYGTGGHRHAAIWTNADNWENSRISDLGTLQSDNSGDSLVSALSDDGKIAAGSASYNDDNDSHAALWVRGSDGKYAHGIDLGTLKTDNSGESAVTALSADGTIAGGNSIYGRSSHHAVIWRSSDGWKKKKNISMQDLGTLRQDNSGNSYVTDLSADGTVAVGQAVNDKGDMRAVVWRLRYDNRNSQAIDDKNTKASVKQLAGDSFNFMDQQRLSLGRLQDGCEITRDGRFCTSVAGVGSGVGGVSINGKAIGVADLYTYAQAAFGYAFTQGFASGVTLSTGVGSLPPGDLKRDGINPGAGVWARWREATEDGYWYLRGSAAASRAKIRRTRTGADIEPGQGSSTSKAWGVTSEFGRVHNYDFADKIRVRYYGGLRQNDVHLSGYTETRAPDFPFSWTGVTSSQTDVYIGVHYRMAFGKAWYGGIQAELQHDLLHKDPSSTAYAKHFANVSCDSDVAHTRAALSANLSYAVSDAIVVSFNPFVQDSVTDQTFYGAMLRISGAF